MRREFFPRVFCLIGLLAMSGCNGADGSAPAFDVAAEVSADLSQPDDLHVDLAPEAGVDGILPEDSVLPPEDIVEPPIEVTISSPLPGLVRGTVEFSASATADQGVMKVRFLVDSGLLFEDQQVPYMTSWDTGEFDDGEHELGVIAFDTANETATAAVLVTVDNTSPELSLDSPADGEIQGDDILLAATATDNIGMDRVEFTVDDQTPVVVEEEPWEIAFDASALVSGVHVATARALDVAGNEAVVTREFLLDRPPIVALISPQPETLVPGPVTVQAQVGDDVGIKTATLLVDEFSAIDLTDVGGGLFEGEWTPAYEKGERLLTVVVEDSAGQFAEASVSVLVNHPMTISLLRCVDDVCETLDDDQELTGAVSLRAEVQDDGPEISGVTLSLDGAPLFSDADAPYDFLWDTIGTDDGAYVLAALATNADGEEAEVQVPVQINNCDQDHDDAQSMACGGADCADDDPLVGPAAADPVGDGIDANCDGADGVDGDGDGDASEGSGGDDCDDSDPDVHPCADDLPGDGLDANCDGVDLTSCDDCSPCTVDSWLGSQCVHAPYPDGSPCDDGDVCTDVDQCQGGVCIFEEAMDCEDDNSCTTEFCHPIQGCTYENLSFVPCPGGVCVAGGCCTPDCGGKICGPDGCGGLCGVCPEGLICSFDGQCLEECVIAPFADVAMKINSLEMGSGGYPGMALDLDGDPATCAPEGNCSGGMHNEIGGLFAQLTAYMDVNEELANTLESGDVILLADFAGLNLNGDPFIMRMFTGEATLPQQQCDWQSDACPYLVSHDSFHPSTCEPYMQFDNAAIIDGKLTAGGPGYTFGVASPLGDLGGAIVLDCHLAQVEGDVVVGEDGNVIALQNLVFGAAVPKQSLFDSIAAMPADEVPVSPEMIVSMLDMFLENDIDVDGDGVNESVSFAVMHDAIPAYLVGITEPDICDPECQPWQVCAEGACQSPPSLGDCPMGGVAVDVDCHDIDFEGCCGGTDLYYCGAGAGQCPDGTSQCLCLIECGVGDKVCSWEADEGYFDCATGIPLPNDQGDLFCDWYSCAPDCTGKECGFDGCMGTCGSCPAGQLCSDTGTCEFGDFCELIGFEGCCDGTDLYWCVNGEIQTILCGNASDPALQVCGWDSEVGYNCGGSGADPGGQFPLECPACIPDCSGKDCGSDGCGGTCGTCAGGAECSNGICQSSCVMLCSSSGSSFSAGLSCGAGSKSCNYSYNSFGQVSGVSCSYGNGTSFSCSVTYNGLGQPSGYCSGEGDTCSF
ncbi:MAG: Ig-like domain-containing protein [Pseudomonadota bacterium]